MHQIECLCLAYVCIEHPNKSYVWAVGRTEWGDALHNVLKDRQGKSLTQLQSCSRCFFFSETKQLPHFENHLTWSVVMDGSDSSSQRLFEYASWSSGGFWGAWCFLLRPTGVQPSGPNRWTGLPWKTVSSLAAKPTSCCDPVAPYPLPVLTIPLFLQLQFSSFSCVTVCVRSSKHKRVICKCVRACAWWRTCCVHGFM